jgi:hypothetical protein
MMRPSALILCFASVFALLAVFLKDHRLWLLLAAFTVMIIAWLYETMGGFGTSDENCTRINIVSLPELRLRSGRLYLTDNWLGKHATLCVMAPGVYTVRAGIIGKGRARAVAWIRMKHRERRRNANSALSISSVSVDTGALIVAEAECFEEEVDTQRLQQQILSMVDATASQWHPWTILVVDSESRGLGLLPFLGDAMYTARTWQDDRASIELEVNCMDA